VRLETEAGDPIVARSRDLVEVRYRVPADSERSAIHFTLRTDDV